MNSGSSLEFLFRLSTRCLREAGCAQRISSFKQMTLKRRDKLVYFRISGEEFEQILKACDAKGARSVSDLARAAVQEFIKDSEKQSEGEMTDFLKRLQKTVDELKQSVQLLVANGVKPEPRRSSDPDSDSYKAPKQTVTQAARK